MADPEGGTGTAPLSAQIRDRSILCSTSKMKMSPIFIVIIYDFKYLYLRYYRCSSLYFYWLNIWWKYAVKHWNIYCVLPFPKFWICHSPLILSRFFSPAILHCFIVSFRGGHYLSAGGGGVVTHVMLIQSPTRDVSILNVASIHTYMHILYFHFEA